MKELARGRGEELDRGLGLHWNVAKSFFVIAWCEAKRRDETAVRGARSSHFVKQPFRYDCEDAILWMDRWMDTVHFPGGMMKTLPKKN